MTLTITQANEIIADGSGHILNLGIAVYVVVLDAAFGHKMQRLNSALVQNNIRIVTDATLVDLDSKEANVTAEVLWTLATAINPGG